MYTKANIIFVIFLLLTFFGWSQQNIAPTLTAVGDQEYCTKSQIRIVTDFNIIDPDDTEILALYIQISTGYVRGEDILLLSGSHPNVSTSWNLTEGKLTLSGIGAALVSYTDLVAATKDIVFQSTSNNPIDKVFSITIGDVNYLPSTDHYYEYVPNLGITWKEAKIASEARTYFGLKGYLATITSTEEAQLSGEQAAGAGWIGGTDEETEGVWKWVTGPEAGTTFWNGGINGTTPNFAFWNTSEPNQLGDEDYAHVTAPGVGIPGSWNDLSNIGAPTGDFQPKGYIVEYGSPQEPSLNISTSSKINAINTFIIDTNPAFLCGSGGSVTLEATASQGDALWFDSNNGNVSIASGPTFTTPILNATTTYYVSASFNGCLNDERIPVVATIYQLPIVQPSITFKNCDEDGIPDGFTDYNLTEANDIITNNNSVEFNITYHTTTADANSGLDAVNAFLFNNSISNVVYARVENTNGCYSVSQVNLQVSTTSFTNGYLQELNTCDDDATIDGKHVFDLTQASAAFIKEFPTGQNLSVTYYRNLNDAQLEHDEITEANNFINETPFSQLLYVRVESDSNGECFGIGPHLLLTVNPRPEFKIAQTGIYCSDSSPITLFTFNASGNYSYEWKDENGVVVSTLPSFNVASGGIYTVIASSSLGCESFPISYNIVESAVASIELDDITIVEVSNNNSISINNNNLGIGDYEFSLEDINGAYQDEPFFDSVAAGAHIVYVRDKNSCGIVSIEVFILGFPKYFTPNNDGSNDTWQIKGLGNNFLDNSVVSVFDRYGKLIKQLNAKNGTWDGTFNGQQLATSDYWFVAELIRQDGIKQIYRGHFSLVN